jgi:hypothetical protein
MSALIGEAKKDGYNITAYGMLCWMDPPPTALVPVLRARVLVIEALFCISFVTQTYQTADRVYTPDFFLWNRDDMPWELNCVYLSSGDSIRTAKASHRQADSV